MPPVANFKTKTISVNLQTPKYRAYLWTHYSSMGKEINLTSLGGTYVLKLPYLHPRCRYVHCNHLKQALFI